MKNTIQPSHMIVMGVCAMLGASFFAVAHVGAAKRQVRGMEYGFGSRKAPEPPPEAGLAANFKRGAQTIADKAGGLVDDVFSWGSDSPASATLTASADQDSSGESADEKDPFEDFYNRNYAKGNGGSASASGGFSGFGGFGGSSGGSWGSSGGGGGGGDDGLPSGGGQTAKAPAKESAGEEAAAGRAPRATRPSVEDASGDWVKYPGRKGAKQDSAGQLASLPSGGSADGPFSNPLNQASKSGKGGSLSEMPGQKGAADLNGASEQARNGAEGGYNSKMSGGAAAAAAAGASAAGGGGVPAASAPKEVGADGKGSGSAAGGKDAKDSKDAKTASSSDSSSKSSGWNFGSSSSRGAVVTASAAPIAEEEPDFLKTLMNERQKGAESSFIREEDASAKAPASQLRSGALIVPPQQKRALADGEEEPPVEPDPEKFSKLSAERKKELKTEVHTFLRQVENQYGGMTDMLFTPCSKAKEVCADHGLKMGYLTMHTAEGARVQLSLKYSDKKWVPYTVSFGSAVKMPKPAAPPETPVEEPAGDDSDGGGSEPGSDDGLMWV